MIRLPLKLSRFAMFAVALLVSCVAQPEEQTMSPMERKLEAIRTAAITYLETEKPEDWEIHKKEVAEAPFLELAGQYRLGIWIYDNARDELIRDSELQPLTIRFGMRFERVEGQTFRVIDHFWEKERFNFED